MKKLLIIFALMFYVISLNNSAIALPSDEKGIVKSVMTYSYTTSGQDFIENHIFTYNKYGNITTELVKIKDNEEFIVNNRVTHFYDYNGNDICWIAEHYNKGKWTESTRSTSTYDENSNLLTCLILIGGNRKYSYRKYTYDKDGNQLTKLYKQWDFELQELLVNELAICTYDSRGNMLTYSLAKPKDNGVEGEIYYIITYKYDVNYHLTSSLETQYTNNHWQNVRRKLYAYDERGNRIKETVETWEKDRWVGTTRETYTSDDRGNRLTAVHEEFYNGEWDYSSRYVYTYDTNNNRLTEYSENWHNGNWIPIDRRIDTYDENNNWLTCLYQKYYDNKWENRIRKTLIYNEDGFNLIQLNEKWEDSTWVEFAAPTKFYDAKGRKFYYIVNKIEVTYTNATAVEGEDATTENIKVYPNPATEFLNIEGIASEGEFTIYNSSGTALKEYGSISNCGNATRIDVSALPNGYYIIKYDDNTGMQAIPFVISR